jgi:muramoyltetrapeptide carboxypeptidase
MKAKKLLPGDTIGIVAPASPASWEATEKAMKQLYDLGHPIKLGCSVTQSRGYLAGSDEIRAEDINRMFGDREVKAIFCLRGGYGSPRILDKIDYRLIRENPKIFMGYSDITALHLAIYQRCKLVTFHGPMPASDMTEALPAFTEGWLYKAIAEDKPMGKLYNPKGYALHGLIGGRAKGRLIGGNLSLMAASLGTPYEIDTRDKLLFIEEIGEEPYRVDRMLNQLRLSGKLKDAAAILLCDFRDCQTKYSGKSLKLEEVFEDMLMDLKKPVLCGYKIGHCTPQITIPIGVRAMVDSSQKELILLEKAVISD